MDRNQAHSIIFRVKRIRCEIAVTTAHSDQRKCNFTFRQHTKWISNPLQLEAGSHHNGFINKIIRYFQC